jgi:oligoribonuclease NrnB/cAMP/cGMP phosphodiesterase (DHH superfamily)
MNQKVLCIYHKDCMDGYASAWVVGYACGFENVEFLAANYGDELPDLTGREVYIVDFSYDPGDVPRQMLREMAKAKRLVMLDHHATAWEAWQDVPLLEHWTFRYEPNMSGVGVTWRWFFGGNRPMPMALQLVQDRDLWSFQLPGTREFHAVAVSHGLLRETPREESWLGDEVLSRPWFDGPPSDSVMIEGRSIIRDQKNLIQTMIRRARIVNFRGYQVPVCAMPHEMRSEAGHLLNAQYPFSITYDDVWSEGVRKYSLRSRRKGGANLLPIAAYFGGGGHQNASGFTMALEEPFPFSFVDHAQLKLDLEAA